MVALPKKSWLAAVRIRLTAADFSPFHADAGQQQQKLGILSFEAAKTMTRLISLHRSITDPELVKLRSSTLRSQGVAYLNSTDNLHLLRVACAEIVDDLDHAAASIARLGERCRVNWPRGFDLIYNDLKSGCSADFVLGFPAKDLDKKVKKMEGYLSATSALHREMEALADLEASERNLERWRNYSGPITAGGPPAVTGKSQADPPGADLLMKKLAEQRRVVAKLQEDSLWGRSYEKVADLMSRSVVTLFARICSIFSLIVTDLPLVVFERDGRYRFAVNRRHYNPHQLYFSGPLERPTAAGSAFFRNSGPILRPTVPKTVPKEEVRSWTVNYLDAPAGTVGEAGLALRYADVIVLAEEMLFSPESAGKDAREELYQMLPSGLRASVMAKLRQCRRVDAEARDDEKMAAGWKEAAGRILQWLGPMAHDTVRWHAERSCERQRMEPAPKVLLLQTLHLADREKAEAAIVEVLVGLSCVYRYQPGVFCVCEKAEDSD